MKEFLEETLQQEGIKVVGCTPNKTSRGEEIRAWLDEHPETQQFVALEDSPNHIFSFDAFSIPYT